MDPFRRNASVNDTSETSPPEPKLRHVIREDLTRGDFQRTVRKEYAELKEFFLDDERKARLNEMSRLKRWIFTALWLMTALFRKLTPVRRILLLAAVILLIVQHDFSYASHRLNIQIDTGIFACFILLFILMLELKDKLLAHDELEAGRAIQSALMPEQSPSVPGWSIHLNTRTANEVGGDLVDFQELGPDRYLLTLADVAGKGLKAALVTSKLQSTIRALAPETSSLEDLVFKINLVFHRDTVRNIFASLVCIEFSPSSGSVRLVNAGHLPPVLVTREGLSELAKGDPAIGIIPDIRYHCQKVQIRKEEVLFIYSDGLTEAKNERGDFYGQGRVQAILPSLQHLNAEQISDRIILEVERFIGEARRHDDLSLIVMKRIE